LNVIAPFVAFWQPYGNAAFTTVISSCVAFPLFAKHCSRDKDWEASHSQIGSEREPRHPPVEHFRFGTSLSFRKMIPELAVLKIIVLMLEPESQ
jgi:hypothetical protein